MAMNKREKTLVMVTGGLLLLAVGQFFLSGMVGPPETLRGRRATLAAEVQQKQDRLDAAFKARERLEAWNRRSLPSDAEAARTLYQSWLLEQFSGAKLREAKVESREKTTIAGAYDRLSFTVAGRGTPEQVADFLHRFYTAGHLHKIRSLTLTPVKGSPDLTVNFTIEALSLPGADRKDRLSEEKGNRLADAKLESYVKAVGGRRPFSAHQPAATPGKTQPKELSVTGIGEIDGQPQAWVTVASTGEKARLTQGQTFEFKQVKGKLLRIVNRTVVLEVDGGHYLFNLGDSLDKAKLVGGKPMGGPMGMPPGGPMGGPMGMPMGGRMDRFMGAPPEGSGQHMRERPMGWPPRGPRERRPRENATDAPAGNAAEKPAEKPAEGAAEEPAEKPAEKPAESPSGEKK
jgi:hypothetical protein